MRKREYVVNRILRADVNLAIQQGAVGAASATSAAGDRPLSSQQATEHHNAASAPAQIDRQIEEFSPSGASRLMSR